MPTAPPAVRWITGTLERAGFETWAVGGAVRDVLLGRESGDWDLATRARPGQVRRLFRRTVPLGIEHGTVGVLARDGTLYEVTTFRRDVITTGRHAVVEFADRIEDDLSRRDFTINAIAWHPLREELLDPHGGLADLRAHVLRTVGRPELRFAEDYLRVLRALRFAGRFRLEIDPDTWDALRSAVAHLDVLSRERVREELMKVLGGDPKPSRTLELYRASGALEAVAPELAAVPGHPVPDSDLPGVDAWTWSLEVTDRLSRSRPLLRLVALLEGLGLPGKTLRGAGEEAPAEAARGGRPAGGRRSRGGDPSGGADASRPSALRWRALLAAERSAALLIRLRFSNAHVDKATALLAAGPEPPDPASGGVELRRWLSRTGPERLADLTRLWVARERALSDLGVVPRVAARDAWHALRAELRRRPPLSLSELALDGRDLIRMGLRPGPRFRAILDALLSHVLEHPSHNVPDRLAALVLEWESGELPAPGDEGGV